MSLEQLNQHSPLGPSAAERWINCPGSVRATAGIKDKSSIFAAEGTFAHYISELAREQNKPAADFIGTTTPEDDEFQFTCDKDMAQYVQMFLDYVAQFDCDEELNEAMVQYNAWVDDGFGTLDAGLLSDGVCVVVDLKYGKGIQVFAENNYQLMLYALGVYQEHGHLYDFEKFKLCICQPRLNHIDEWEIGVDALLTWAEEVVEPAADRTADEDAPFKAGPWCDKNFCKIRKTCKVRADAYRDEMLDEISDIRDPIEMDNDELGELASLIPLIQKWAKDVMEQVEKLVAHGEEVIGADGLPFKLVAGRGARSWKDAAAAEKAMRNAKFKIDEIFTKKLVTPPQFEKFAGKDHNIMKKHCVKSHGKPALVPGSDKRPAYKVSSDEMEAYDD
jgi:hypothetical protein